MSRRAAGSEDGAARFVSEEISLPYYLKQIAKTRTLKRVEEAELASRIRKNDRRALERLIQANLRFVVSVAMNYRNQGLSISDLINEGNMGLIRAARRFDESKNFKFISYAVWWVRQAILSALAEQSRVVKLPVNRVGVIYKIGKTSSRLGQKLNRMPNIEEIAKDLRIDDKEVMEALNVGGSRVSLDESLNGQDGAKLLDLLHDPNAIAPDMCISEISLREQIEKILETLTRREAEIVRLYFGIGVETAHTLEEIGERYNLTRERIRQIKEKAMARLKHCSRSKPLRAHFDRI